MIPTDSPTFFPTYQPTSLPTVSSKKARGTTSSPTVAPTVQTVASPTFQTTVATPTYHPTVPSTPSIQVDTPIELANGQELTATPKSTSQPTNLNSKYPSSGPTPSPSTAFPTADPTDFPTQSPTKYPTHRPTLNPTMPPTHQPTAFPTTSTPTSLPSFVPTSRPSTSPTILHSVTPSENPTVSPSSKPTRPPIDFGPRAYVYPDDPVIVRITNLELSFRGVPMEALNATERRQLEAITSSWLDGYYHPADDGRPSSNPHLEFDVQLSLQKLQNATLKVLLEISIGSHTYLNLTSHPNPSSFLTRAWEDDMANALYVERLQIEMPDAFGSLQGPVATPEIRTPIITLPEQKPPSASSSFKSLVAAGVLILFCTVAAAILILRVRTDIQNRHAQQEQLAGTENKL